MISIYVLIDPRTHEVRYVGKTSKTQLSRRLNEHLADARRKARTSLHHWLLTLLRLGYRPRLEVVQTVHESHWDAAERYWISYYCDQGCSLVNTTSGGCGRPR